MSLFSIFVCIVPKKPRALPGLRIWQALQEPRILLKLRLPCSLRKFLHIDKLLSGVVELVYRAQCLIHCVTQCVVLLLSAAKGKNKNTMKNSKNVSEEKKAKKGAKDYDHFAQEVPDNQGHMKAKPGEALVSGKSLPVCGLVDVGFV